MNKTFPGKKFTWRHGFLQDIRSAFLLIVHEHPIIFRIGGNEGEIRDIESKNPILSKSYLYSRIDRRMRFSVAGGIPRLIFLEGCPIIRQ